MFIYYKILRMKIKSLDSVKNIDQQRKVSKDNLPYNYTVDILRKIIKPYRQFDQVVKGNIKIIKIKDEKIKSQNLNYNYKIVFIKIGNFLVYQVWDKEDSVKINFPKGEHNTTRTLREELINNPDAADVLELTINDDRLVKIEDFKLWITQSFYQNVNSKKPKFQPTAVMEIGNKKFVFVITNAKIDSSDRVVFYVSTKEIRLQKKNNNLKKMVNLPIGCYKNVRVDIDPVEGLTTAISKEDSVTGKTNQFACPPSFFINAFIYGVQGYYPTGCSPELALSNFLAIAETNFIVPACFFSGPTGPVYNSIVGPSTPSLEWPALTVLEDTLGVCPCGITAIDPYYIVFYGKSTDTDIGYTPGSSSGVGNQCNAVHVWNGYKNDGYTEFENYNIPPAVRFDPSVNYQGQDGFNQYVMSGWFLTNADFTNCNLNGIQFSNSTFSPTTIFTGASLVGAKFYFNGIFGGSQSTILRTNLTGVNFSDINNSGGGLTNADFTEATLVNVNFSNVNLSGANFSGPGNGNGGANLTGANLTGANLTGANVNYANFTNAILTGTNLSGVNFINGVNLQGITSGNITTANGPASLPFVDGGDTIGNYVFLNGYIVGATANLTNANLYALDLTKVSLFETILTGVSSGDIYWPSVSTQPDLPNGYILKYGYILGSDVNLSGADLSGLDLSNLNLSHVNFENAIMAGTNLSNTNLGSANLKGLKLNVAKPIVGFPALPSGYQLINGIIIGQNIIMYAENLLSYANLSNLNFSNIEIGYSTFYGIDFSNSDFTNSYVINSTFENCIFSGANVTNTSFAGTNFIGVRISSPLTGQPASIPGYNNVPFSLINGYFIGPTMDLRRANLSGLNLSNINMNNANITDANMTGVMTGGITGPLIMSPMWKLTTNGYLLCPGSNLSNLDSSVFYGVMATNLDLTGVNFENTKLDSAIFDNSKFINANLNNASISSSFRGVDFTNAKLTNINITAPYNNNNGFNVKSIDFTNAILTGADVTGSNLYGAYFQGNTCPVIGGNSGTIYPDGIVCDNGYIFGLISSPTGYYYKYNTHNLTGVSLNIFSDLSLYDHSYANFTRSNFSGVNISNLNFENAIFTGVVSGGTTGQNYTLPTDWSVRNGYLIGPTANLSNANLSGSYFDLNGTNLSGANLAGAYLYEQKLIGANLTGATLSISTGIGSGEFLSANFKNANLNGAILSGVIINGAVLDFENVSFDNANFTGADFRGATFNGAYGTGIIGVPQFVSGYAVINGSLLGPSVYLQGATFKNSPNLIGIGLDLTGANFTYAESDGTVIPSNLTQGVQGAPIFPSNYTILQGYVIGPGVQIFPMTLSDVTFSQLYNNIVSLNNVIIDEARFTNLDFTLSNSNFTIQNAAFGGVSFFNSNCANVDFSGSKMINVQFSGTNLAGANFSNVTFTGDLTFESNGGVPVDLTGANFQNATITSIVCAAGSFTGTPNNFPFGFYVDTSSGTIYKTFG